MDDDEYTHTDDNRAAAVVENVRLLEAERHRREAEILREAAASLTSTLNLNEVLQNILIHLEKVVPSDSSTVFLYKENRLRITVCRGFPDPEALIGRDFPAESPLFRIIRKNQQTLILDDAQADPRFQRWGGTSYVHGWMGIPLIVHGKVIGYLTCDSRQSGFYQQTDAVMAEAFANQAAIAIENAQLYEAEGKRAAELEAVRQINLSLTASLELRQVLDAILKGTLNLLPEAQNGHIFLYSPEAGGRLTFGAALWADGPREQAWINPRPHGLTYSVARLGEPIVVPNMRSHELYRDTPPDWDGAIVGLPLKIGQRVVGVMNVSYRKPHFFSDVELRVLRLIGDQAAIAIENARLFEQAATERRHLSLLYEVGRELATTLDPDEILKYAISLTCKALNGMVGQAFLYQPEENCLSIRALYGRPDASLSDLDLRFPMQPGFGLVGWVAQNRQSTYAPDVGQDERWYYVPGIDDDVRSALSAPILAGDRLLGVLTVLHQQANAFSADHLDLLQAICQEVGLALSNASRYQQAQRQLAELTLIQNLTLTFNQRLEVQVLLDEAVNQLGQRLGFPQVEIFLMEGDNLNLRAYYGAPPLINRLPISEGIVGRVARTGQVAFAADVLQDPDYQPFIGDTISELAVPIFRRERVVGVINIQSNRTGQIGERDRDLLQVLAGQISVTLENAVLYEDIRRHAEGLEQIVAQRTAELTELYKLSQEIGYKLSYDELLHLLIHRLKSATQSNFVIGCLVTNSYRALCIETNLPLEAQVLSGLRTQCLSRLGCKKGDVTSLEDLQVYIIQAEDYQGQVAPVMEIPFLIQSPIMVEQKTMGLLMAGSTSKDAFGAEQERLVTTFANQAAAAIQRLSAILTAQQKHLESLVEHMPVGVLLYDSGFNLLVANPLGRELLSNLKTGKVEETLSQLGPYSLQDLLSHQFDPLPLEISLDGPPRRYFAAQVRSVGDEKRQWVLTLREITQERESQARIQSQERLATVGQLAAGIAHDFNNIMAAILVYADLLHKDPDLPAASRERLAIIQQQVQRAASLIRQILDFSRRSIMDQSSLDLLPFIKELDKLLGRVLPETIRLELTYQPTAYWVKADPTRLQQVFMNLALNARDAMPEGGILRFELNRLKLMPGMVNPFPNMPSGDWVRIKVSDTGTGIPAEAMEHLFEPFFTTKPVGQGTGLGLAQVYGIVKQHEGYIDVQSRTGEGASFIIYLPALSIEDEKRSPVEASALFDGDGESVLVVEDDFATRQALQALLEAHNYVVFTASNGIEALQCFEQVGKSLSFAVSDVVMPQMGGVALYQALQERWPGVKMLFVTGHPMDEKSQVLLEKGHVRWLQKPFSISEFEHAIRLLILPYQKAK